MAKEVKTEVKTVKFGLLEVLNDDGSSEVHPLQPHSFVIGSSMNAHIRLKKNARDVECIVNVHNNGVTTLTPQTAFHPTRLNGDVLRINKAVLLKPGDIFVVADVKIVYKNNSLTEQELQQKGRFVRPPKIFNTTPLRRMTFYKQASLTNSTKKKSKPPISRNTPIQKRRSSASSLNENVFNCRRTRPAPELLLPSGRNISGDPIEDADVNNPTSGSSFQRKVSKCGATTPGVRGLKRASSTLSIDSGDSEKRLTRKSTSLMKPDLTNIMAFDTVASNTPKKADDRLPERLCTEEDLPISGRETPETVSHFSAHNHYSVLGEQPTQLTRTKSVSDLTAPVFGSKSKKRGLLRNNSFAAVSNKKAETPKAATIFKTPTSSAKKCSKFNILDKSREQPTPSPAPVTSRSRSLSSTSRQSSNSAWESLTEDIEQAQALSPNIQSRRSRQSVKNVNTKSEDSEQTNQSQVSLHEDFVARRSKSLTPEWRKPENDTFNESVEANQHLVSSPRSLFINTVNRASRRSRSIASRQPEHTPKKFKRGVSMENINQAVSTPSVSSSGVKSQRSRSMFIASKQSGNDQLNKSLEDNQQVRSSTSKIADRSSRLLLPRQFENDMLPLSPNIAGRRSRRSLLALSRVPENDTLTNLKRGVSVGNVKQKLLTPVSSSSSIETRGSKRPSTGQSGDSPKNFKSVCSLTTSTVPNEDETTDMVLDSTFNTDGSGTWQSHSTGPRDDLSTLDSSGELTSSFNDTTNSSSFVHQNSPTHLSSVQLTESVINVSGVEKLTKTPKQARNSSSSAESDRRSYSGKPEKSITPLITFSSTFNHDTSVGSDDDECDDVDDGILETTESELIVVEQTFTVKTPKNDVNAKQMAKMAKVQKSPKNDLCDVRGVKKIMATPKAMRSPKNDLNDVRGLKKIMATPKAMRSPKNDLNDVRGVKRLLGTPTKQNSPQNDLRNVRGVKKIMRTPKTAKSPTNDLRNPPGFKHLFEVPKSPKNDLRDVRGIKGILKTPKPLRSPRNDLRNPPEFKKLFELPKSARNNLDNFEGIKELMATPVVAKAPNSDRADVKQIMKTPNLPKSPKNDLRGTPKRMKTPKNDLSDVESVDIVMKTPNVPKSPKRLSNAVDSGVLGEILNAIQVTKTDHHRQTVLSSKRIRERASKNDYTDVRGVKRMFAEEEAAFKNVSNVSGVAELFNVSNTPTSSEAFTALFNKKPLRTYQSKSPSPHKLSRSVIRKNSADVSPTEPSVSSDVVNWVKTVNQQFVTNAVEAVSPNKNMKLLTPVVVLKRSKRLASRTPTPSKNLDSPPVRRVRSVKEKLVTSTPLANKLDLESNEASDKPNAEKIKKGILKELVNSNANSPVSGSRRPRKPKNLGEATKENITPDQSSSDIQVKMVTFDVEGEETRRSKRTPRKPAKLAGFVSEMPSKTVKNRRAREENRQQASSPQKEEPIVKQGRPKRGAKAADKKTNEITEKPAPKKSRKKAETLNERADLSDKEESQTVVENDESNTPTKRRRGRPVKGNEKSPAIAEPVEEKPAKRLRGKRDIAEPLFETKNDKTGKNIPTKGPGRKRKHNEAADPPEKESEANNITDAEEARPMTRRGRKPLVAENDSDCSVIKDLEKQKPAMRGRPKKTKSPNVSEMSDTKEQKPVTKRGRKRINEEVNQTETKQLAVNNDVTPVQKRGRRNVSNNKIEQPEVEVKKAVTTRGQKQNTNEPVTRRGRKQPNTETEQLEKADVEVTVNKAEVNAAKRGRKPAIKQQTVNEEEADEKSKMLDTSDPTPLRRTTRRAVPKRVYNQDAGPANNVQQKGKRARKETADDQPIKKSARTRR